MTEPVNPEIKEPIIEEKAPEAAAPPPPPPEDPLVVLQRQLDEMKDKYLRSLADQENARKRLSKEKQEIIGYAIESTVGDFLPVIDHFENAMRFADAASGEVKNWAMGFQMILSQFKQVLQNYSISAYTSEGETFDPTYHDAVETIETSDVSEGTVLKEFTKGYKSASRVIRPARVQVAKAPRKAVEPASEPAPAAQEEN